MRLEVYSDGSATTSDKPGGWGYVIVNNGVKVAEGCGHMTGATNNDAELEAAVQGLIAAFKMADKAAQELEVMACSVLEGVTLVSDSQIVLGWASGRYRFKQLSKMDQYKKLMMLVQRMDVGTRWVQGHSGDEHNERCDALANAARTGKGLDAPKKKKTKKIGNRAVGVVGLQCVGGQKILVDLVNLVCQNYNEAEHGIREVWIEVKDQEGLGNCGRAQGCGAV